MISYRDLSICLQNGIPEVEQSSVNLKMYDGSIMQPGGFYQIGLDEKSSKYENCNLDPLWAILLLENAIWG